MSNYRTLTSEEIENIIAITDSTIAGYLTRFNNEIEIKALKNSAVLNLPLHPENVCELIN